MECFVNWQLASPNLLFEGTSPYRFSNTPYTVGNQKQGGIVKVTFPRLFPYMKQQIRYVLGMSRSLSYDIYFVFYRISYDNVGSHRLIFPVSVFIKRCIVLTGELLSYWYRIEGTTQFVFSPPSTDLRHIFLGSRVRSHCHMPRPNSFVFWCGK